MEKGFYHESRGYWQTTNEPPQYILDGYPEGTVEVPLPPSPNHTWNGNEWVENPLLLNEKSDILAAYRYERETEGITVNGAQIRTDRQTQAMLLGARTRAKENSDLVMPWKAVNGFVELTAPQIIAIADAVADHVQKCFTSESQVDLAECETESDITAAFDAAYSEL